VLLEIDPPRRLDDGLEGRVLAVDSFGNLITNFEAAQLAGLGTPARCRVGGRDAQLAGLVRTYGEATAGSLVALVGSSGRLEIAVVGGSAARQLGAGRGDAVRFRFGGPGREPG
jgi:hypothetical protein